MNFSMNLRKQWYALYTSIDCEIKVAKSLRKKKIEYYCPINRITNKNSSNKKLIIQPLFSRLIFVHVDKAAYKTFKQIPGVRGMMYWLNQPAFFPDEDIEMMRRFLNAHVSVELSSISVNINEVVSIVSSTLKERHNQNLSIIGRNIQLVLPSLGYILSAELESVEAINPKHNYISPINKNLAFR